RRRAGQCGERLPSVYRGLLRERRTRLERDAARVTPAAILRRTERGGQALAALDMRGGRAFLTLVERARTRRDQAVRLVESLSYKAVLARGFALVRDGADRPVKQAAAVTPGMALSIEFADAVVQAVAADRGGTTRPARKPAAPAPKKDQGSLF
ncbi:exodeoxyribonuclease VII large subunit, partial [Aquibium sp. A9E412]|uniref:exodeoxyribonuclease VII large subunit n=1 Tax=Aquibium sp. A9E412 TaxID=2976767 RepID=UPI0025AFB8D6